MYITKLYLCDSSITDNSALPNRIHAKAFIEPIFDIFSALEVHRVCNETLHTTNNRSTYLTVGQKMCIYIHIIHNFHNVYYATIIQMVLNSYMSSTYFFATN